MSLFAKSLVTLVFASCLAGPVLAGSSMPELPAPESPRVLPAQATFNGCGWYAILMCTESRSEAQRNSGEGLMVIRTNDYPNFRPGFWCVADGPYTRRSGAENIVNQWRQDFKSAYIKQAC